MPAKNEPNFKNINGYAVNGAVHYANALLHHTSHTDIIAIGMTGYKKRLLKLKRHNFCIRKRYEFCGKSVVDDA